jgi:hypothetical protein
MEEYLIIIILIILILIILSRKSNYDLVDKSVMTAISWMTDAQFLYTLFYMKGANRPTDIQVLAAGVPTPAGNWVCNSSGGSQACALWSMPFDAVANYNKLQDFCTIAINQIKGANSYDLINKYLPSGILPYSSDSELNAVFDSAYTNGEPTGTSAQVIRDRTMLHMVAYIYTGLTTIGAGMGGYPFPENGRVSWTSQVMSVTGKTANEVLSLGYEITKNFLLPRQYYESISTIDLPAAITYINSVLPSNFNKYYIPSGSMSGISPAAMEFSNEDSSLHPENEARWPWLCRVSSIGQIYVAYLVKEKWKLDMNWVPPGFPIVDNVVKKYLDPSSSVDFSGLKFETSYGSGSGSSGSGSGSGS